VAKLAAYERKLENFDRRLEREKLESLKELAYGASHEINNPLANIAARAQTLLADEADPERARKLSAIHRQSLRAHEMISDLMLFARPPKLVRQPFDLRQLVQRVVNEQCALAVENYVEIICEVGGEPIDETQLGVAIHAILKNTLEALPPGGHVWIATRHITMGAEPFAEVNVRDDGPGISDAVRKHLFDPFFSGREAGESSPTTAGRLSYPSRAVVAPNSAFSCLRCPAAGALPCRRVSPELEFAFRRNATT
jgi:signal transduction histidine kinase